MLKQFMRDGNCDSRNNQVIFIKENPAGLRGLHPKEKMQSYQLIWHDDTTAQVKELQYPTVSAVPAAFSWVLTDFSRTEIAISSTEWPVNPLTLQVQFYVDQVISFLSGWLFSSH